MYAGKKILMVICARGGSKGIPGKNIRLLAGKPLIAHSILAAKESGLADRIVVSTDDAEIASVAKKHGAEVPFLRPKELANDTIGRIAAVIYTTQAAEKHYQERYDIVIDLGNMCPLRSSEDIQSVVQTLIETEGTDLVFTVTPAARNPYYNMVEITDKGLAVMSKHIDPPPSSRQQTPAVYDMNDSVYAFWRNVLLDNATVTVPIQLVPSLKKRVVVMPEERSVDIDRLIDFQLTELLLQQEKE